MLIKGIVDEDFINYKLPSMYIATATCSFKCDKEYGQPICQNSELAKQPDIDINPVDIICRYMQNDITKAIVFGGLEPFDTAYDMYGFIGNLRVLFKCDDDVVIYTGYTKKELEQMNFCDLIPNPDGFTFSPNRFHSVLDVFRFQNVIIKFGRYIPDQQPHFDPVLGVYLASDNQYAERIS